MHIADHYLDEACESDIVELVLSRMEGYKQMTPGKRGPGLCNSGPGGNESQALDPGT